MKKTVTVAVAAVVSIIMVAALLSQIKIGDIIDVFSRVNLPFLMLGFALYGVTHLFRSIRFRVLVKGRVGVKDMFSIVCVHTMTNEILPAKTGEISYIYLLKKLHGIKTGDGVASLVVARVFDAIMVSLIFVFSAMLISNLPDIIYGIIWFVSAFAALAVLVLVVFIRSGQKFTRGFRKLVEGIGISRFGKVQYLLRKIDETAQSFNEIGLKSILWKVTISSIILWTFYYLTFYFIIQSFGVNLSFFDTVIICSFSNLVLLLPITVFAGFGTTEGSIAVLMVLFGIGWGAAIATAFGIHIVSIIYLALFGVFGFWKLGTKAGKTNNVK